jgi:hypothetical protein
MPTSSQATPNNSLQRTRHRPVVADSVEKVGSSSGIDFFCEILRLRAASNQGWFAKMKRMALCDAFVFRQIVFQHYRPIVLIRRLVVSD